MRLEADSACELQCNMSRLTWTKWPPNRTCAPIARSRLTGSPTFLSPTSPEHMIQPSLLEFHERRLLPSLPRSVLWSVSFASHTVNQPPFSTESKAVTVKHAPFTAIESPMWQSERMGAELPMVSVHPPSSRAICVTRPRCSTYELGSESACFPVYMLYDEAVADQAGEHFVGI